jgi:disulfide oxidoreductase YuzD
LLGVSNSHVEKDRRKIEDGKPLSPILLVRDEPNGRVVIADGYHRLCAVYSFEEDECIPCKIV